MLNRYELLFVLNKHLNYINLYKLHLILIMNKVNKASKIDELNKLNISKTSKQYSDNYSLKIISNLKAKGFESLSLDDMAYIINNYNSFEKLYLKCNNALKKFPYKVKIMDRLSHSNYNLKWGKKALPTKLSNVISTPIQMFYNLLDNNNTKNVCEYIRLNNRYLNDLINSKDLNMKSALHYTARKGNTELSCFLIKRNFNLDARDKQMKTPLHYACQYSHYEVSKLLIDGCFIESNLTKNDCNNKILNKCDIEAKDNHNRNCLHFAVGSTSIELVLLILSSCKNLINCLDSFNRTPLHYLVWNDCSNGDKIFKLLVEYDVDINATDFDGLTALHYASESGKSKYIPLLINAGIDINIKDTRNKKTALDLACNDYISQLILAYSNYDKRLITNSKVSLSIEGSKLDKNSNLFDKNYEKNSNFYCLKSSGKVVSINNNNNNNNNSKRGRHINQTTKINSNNFIDIENNNQTNLEEYQRNKLLNLMKGVQEYGIKSLKHLSSPDIYTGAWAEDIENINDLNNKLNNMPINEAVLSMFNILNPLNKDKSETLVKELSKMKDNKDTINDYLSFFDSNKYLYKKSENKAFDNNNYNMKVSPTKDKLVNDDKQSLINNLYKYSNFENNNENINKLIEDKVKELISKNKEDLIITNEKDNLSSLNQLIDENNKLEVQAEKLKLKITNLNKKYIEHEDLIDKCKQIEENNKTEINNLHQKIKDLSSLVEDLKKEDLIYNENKYTLPIGNIFSKAILDNKNTTNNNNCNFNEYISEKSMYIFMKYIKLKYTGLEELLIKYDLDNDMYISKIEFSSLLEDIKLDLKYRSSIYSLIGYIDKSKLSIDNIIKMVLQFMESNNYAAIELLFKAANEIKNKSISKSDIINTILSKSDYIKNLLNVDNANVAEDINRLVNDIMYNIENLNNNNNTNNIKYSLNINKEDFVCLLNNCLEVLSKLDCKNLFSLLCINIDNEERINIYNILYNLFSCIDILLDIYTDNSKILYGDTVIQKEKIINNSKDFYYSYNNNKNITNIISYDDKKINLIDSKEINQKINEYVESYIIPDNKNNKNGIDEVVDINNKSLEKIVYNQSSYNKENEVVVLKIDNNSKNENLSIDKSYNFDNSNIKNKSSTIYDNDNRNNDDSYNYNYDDIKKINEEENIINNNSVNNNNINDSIHNIQLCDNNSINNKSSCHEKIEDEINSTNKSKEQISNNLNNLNNSKEYDTNEIKEINYNQEQNEDTNTNKSNINNKKNINNNTSIEKISKNNINTIKNKIDFNKIINGELKIQVKSVENIVLSNYIKNPVMLYLNLSIKEIDTIELTETSKTNYNENKLNNKNNINGLNSKIVPLTIMKDGINKAQFNWAARVPLLNKTLIEIGSFFNILLFNIKSDSLNNNKENSILLGECSLNWTSCLKHENLNSFNIDEIIDLKNKRKSNIGKIGVMVKFIPIGCKDSFYNEDGLLKNK